MVGGRQRFLNLQIKITVRSLLTPVQTNSHRQEKQEIAKLWQRRGDGIANGSSRHLKPYGGSSKKNNKNKKEIKLPFDPAILILGTLLTLNTWKSCEIGQSSAHFKGGNVEAEASELLNRAAGI